MVHRLHAHTISTPRRASRRGSRSWRSRSACRPAWYRPSAGPASPAQSESMVDLVGADDKAIAAAGIVVDRVVPVSGSKNDTVEQPSHRALQRVGPLPRLHRRHERLSAPLGLNHACICLSLARAAGVLRGEASSARAVADLPLLPSAFRAVGLPTTKPLAILGALCALKQLRHNDRPRIRRRGRPPDAPRRERDQRDPHASESRGSRTRPPAAMTGVGSPGAGRIRRAAAACRTRTSSAAPPRRGLKRPSGVPGQASDQAAPAGEDVRFGAGWRSGRWILIHPCSATADAWPGLGGSSGDGQFKSAPSAAIGQFAHLAALRIASRCKSPLARVMSGDPDRTPSAPGPWEPSRGWADRQEARSREPGRVLSATLCHEANVMHQKYLFPSIQRKIRGKCCLSLSVICCGANSSNSFIGFAKSDER